MIDNYCPKCSRTPPSYGLLEAKFCPRCRGGMIPIPEDAKPKHHHCSCGARIMPVSSYCCECGNEVAAYDEFGNAQHEPQKQIRRWWAGLWRVREKAA